MKGRPWRSAVAACTFVVAGHAIGAQARQVADQPACEAVDGLQSADVRAVEADWSLALADGRLVRLAGTETPAQAGTGAERAADGRAKLAAWLVGRPVRMRAVEPAPDRWGRVAALVFAGPPGDASAAGAGTLLVNRALVDAGLSRAQVEAGAHPCWPALRGAEAAAREGGLGVWSDRRYAVREATDTAGLAEEVGTTVLVEGRVAHVGRTPARVYVDLGPRGASVALRFDKRHAFILDQLGLGQDDAVGAVLRARGLLDGRRGLAIDVVDADQVDVLEPGGVTAPAPGSPAGRGKGD